MSLNSGMSLIKCATEKFNSVGCDMVLEQFQNRSFTVTGDLTGLTQNKEAIQKWILLYHFKNAIHSTLLLYFRMKTDAT